MLHVNDNTTDELYRKAAEDYFLKADSPDWDQLANKITPEIISPSAETIVFRIKRYFRRMFSPNNLQAAVSRFRMRLRADKNKKKINGCILYFFPHAYPQRCVFVNAKPAPAI